MRRGLSNYHVSTHLLAQTPSLDVGFLLGSKSAANFDAGKKVIIEVLNGYDLSDGKIHFGLIVYGNSPVLKLAMAKRTDNSMMTGHINGFKHPGQDLELERGLSAAKKYFFEACKQDNSCRKNASKVLLLTTDEKPSASAAKIAYEIANLGVKVVTVLFDAQPGDVVAITGDVIKPKKPIDGDAIAREIISSLFKGMFRSSFHFFLHFF